MGFNKQTLDNEQAGLGPSPYEHARSGPRAKEQADVHANNGLEQLHKRRKYIIHDDILLDRRRLPK